MMHSPAFVIIFRRLRQISDIVNKVSEKLAIDENRFHSCLRDRMKSWISDAPAASSVSTAYAIQRFRIGLLSNR